MDECNSVECVILNFPTWVMPFFCVCFFIFPRFCREQDVCCGLGWVPPMSPLPLSRLWEDPTCKSVVMVRENDKHSETQLWRHVISTQHDTTQHGTTRHTEGEHTPGTRELSRNAYSIECQTHTHTHTHTHTLTHTHRKTQSLDYLYCPPPSPKSIHFYQSF